MSKDVRVIISMMVLCNDIGIVEHDRRRKGLPNVSLVMENNNTSKEKYIYIYSKEKHQRREIAIALNIQHNPYSHIHILTYRGALAPSSTGSMPISAGVFSLATAIGLVRSVSINPGEQALIFRLGYVAARFIVSRLRIALENP